MKFFFMKFSHITVSFQKLTFLGLLVFFCIRIITKKVSLAQTRINANCQSTAFMAWNIPLISRFKDYISCNGRFYKSLPSFKLVDCDMIKEVMSQFCCKNVKMTRVTQCDNDSIMSCITAVHLSVGPTFHNINARTGQISPSVSPSKSSLYSSCRLTQTFH